MMVSALAALLAVSTVQQGADPSRGARDAYTACLRAFMTSSVRERMAGPAFEAALPTQCAQQEAAFRAAIAARERSFRTPAAEIEQIATDELNDARGNIRELYAISTTPR